MTARKKARKVDSRPYETKAYKARLVHTRPQTATKSQKAIKDHLLQECLDLNLMPFLDSSFWNNFCMLTFSVPFGTIFDHFETTCHEKSLFLDLQALLAVIKKHF